MNGPCLCGDPECGRCFPQPYGGPDDDQGDSPTAAEYVEPTSSPTVTNPAFTEDEYDFLESALRHVASVYEDDAKTMMTAMNPSLSEQFRRQAQQARDLADRIALR